MQRINIEGLLATCGAPLPGKQVVIMAGVHGNETCGIRAIEEILPTIKPARGSATFILGNPAAIRAEVRFVEQNLNRMFQDNQGLSAAVRASYEYARSRELLPILNGSDALLDIHSSASLNATPFAISETRAGREIASRFPVEIISSGWDSLEPGGTDGYMSSMGKVGICIECGSHREVAAIGRAKAAIYAFLEAMEILPARSETPQRTRRMIQMHRLYKTQTNFTPSRTFSDFEQLKAGDQIGTDGDKSVCATEDGIVLFVRERLHPGEEAFLLGREVSSL